MNFKLKIVYEKTKLFKKIKTRNLRKLLRNIIEVPNVGGID